MNIDKIYNTDIHESFMSRAIEIAKLGRGCVSPNPMVGCVLVKEGEIIGEGYHQKYGDPHAEVMAIRNSRKNPLDSIAYINLEPCSFIGKTPACTDTLKENGISEVYIGMLDPNPMVNGRGVKELERSGIRTHIGILSEEAAQLNQSFTKWITQGLPYVIAKVAQSNNGYMGIDSNSTTRSSIGMRNIWLDLQNKYESSDNPIVVIGSAPTALMALLDLIEEGCSIPSLIIGMPVGFIGVAESKTRLLNSSCPYIVLEGSKGGASLAAATMNALLSASYK